MGFWTPSSDWLDLSTAKAQVEFYRQDLDFSRKYLAYVKTFEKKRLPNYERQLRIAEKDVKDSIRNLSNAQRKLEETIKRER